MTFAEGLRAFLAELRLDGYSAATLKNYSDQLQRFGEWLAGRRIGDLRSVTGLVMRDYQAHVREERIGRATRSLRLRAVKRLYAAMVERGELLLDPTEGVHPLKRRDSLPRPVLTESEIQRLLAVPDTRRPSGIRNRALLEVLYGTGARIGELERAADRDVDLRSQTLLLRHTKGRKPRVVPLGRNATHWLQRYLADARPVLMGKRRSERALFVVAGGQPLRQVIARQVLDRCRNRAGIRKAVSPHLLRHSCATHLLQAGADLRSIQELLGHTRLTSTVLYTRVAPMEVKATHEHYHPRGHFHAAV